MSRQEYIERRQWVLVHIWQHVPMPGEMTPVWIDREARTMGVTSFPGRAVEREVPISQWRTRYSGPWVYSNEPSIGSIGVIVDDSD